MRVYGHLKLAEVYTNKNVERKLSHVCARYLKRRKLTAVLINGQVVTYQW